MERDAARKLKIKVRAEMQKLGKSIPIVINSEEGNPDHGRVFTQDEVQRWRANGNSFNTASESFRMKG